MEAPEGKEGLMNCCIYCKKKIPAGSTYCNWCGKKQVEDMIEFLLMKQAEKKSDKVGV